MVYVTGYDGQVAGDSSAANTNIDDKTIESDIMYVQEDFVQLQPFSTYENASSNNSFSSENILNENESVDVADELPPTENTENISVIRDNLSDNSQKSSTKTDADIFVEISNPRRKGPIPCIVTLELMTKTNMYDEGNIVIYTCRRKYDDFKWLCEAFIAEWAIVPTLPCNRATCKTMLHLQSIIDRLVAHPRVKSSNQLRIFLIGSQDDLEQIKKESRLRDKRKEKNEVPSSFWKTEGIPLDKDIIMAGKYIIEMETNLKVLVEHFKQNIKSLEGAVPHKPFKALDNLIVAEPEGSYLHGVFSVLNGRITSIEEDVPNRMVIIENTLKQKLKDLVRYLHAAQAYVERVHAMESKVYYWSEAEVKIKNQLSTKMFEKETTERLATELFQDQPKARYSEGTISNQLAQEKEREKKHKEVLKAQKKKPALVKAILELETKLQIIIQKKDEAREQRMANLAIAKCELVVFDQRKDWELQSGLETYLKNYIVVHQDRMDACGKVLATLNSQSRPSICSITL